MLVVEAVCIVQLWLGQTGPFGLKPGERQKTWAIDTWALKQRVQESLHAERNSLAESLWT